MDAGKPPPKRSKTTVWDTSEGNLPVYEAVDIYSPADESEDEYADIQIGQKVLAYPDSMDFMTVGDIELMIEFRKGDLVLSIHDYRKRHSTNDFDETPIMRIRLTGDIVLLEIGGQPYNEGKSHEDRTEPSTTRTDKGPSGSGNAGAVAQGRRA